MAEEDIKLPTITAVSGSCRFVTEKKVKKEVLQLVSVEVANPKENEETLCETVVEATESSIKTWNW